MEMFIQTMAYGILVGAMYGLITLGLGLLMGVMKFLNVAHGTFIVLGGYISYWVFARYGVNPYLSIPLVIVVMFFIGLVVYKVTFSPLLKLPSIGNRLNSSMLITFGIIYVVDNLMTIFWKPDVRSIVAPFTGRSMELFGTKFSITGLCGFAVAIAVAVALYFVLGRTQFGKHVRAATQDAEAASLCGVDVHRTYLISSGIAIALAGVAGVIIVSSYSISPNGGLRWLLVAFVVMILAGEGNINAIVPAGLILGLLEAVGVFIVGAPYRQVVALVIFIVILIFRPQGLFRKRRLTYG
jgi:branched-chain amino acid transport system permease protein